MAIYKLTHSGVILFGNLSIPPDPTNRDYRRYMAWVAEGNVPDPADPLPEPETEIVFPLPVSAPDYLVSSPKVQDDPLAALAAAIVESGKAKKSIAFIALSFVKYLDYLEKRLKK